VIEGGPVGIVVGFGDGIVDGLADGLADGAKDGGKLGAVDGVSSEEGADVGDMTGDMTGTDVLAPIDFSDCILKLWGRIEKSKRCLYCFLTMRERLERLFNKRRLRRGQSVYNRWLYLITPSLCCCGGKDTSTQIIQFKRFPINFSLHFFLIFSRSNGRRSSVDHRSVLDFLIIDIEE